MAPTQDQMMAQLRLIIPAIGTLITAFGIMSGDKVGPIVSALMTSVGPIAYVLTAVWSLVANSRHSIMLSASKPASPGLDAPQIILPEAEKELADKLPSNVTTTGA